MHPISRIDRVVLVVMDGLRAEAVRRLELPTLDRLTRQGAWTLSAQTVRPSVTSAAMTSLFTGVPPESHGIVDGGFAVPRRIHRLQPLTHCLAQARLPSAVYLGRIPLQYNLVASRLGSLAGVKHVRCRGNNSSEIVSLGRTELENFPKGFVFMHWPEADRIGHLEGWQSAAYERAARDMDTSLEQLVEILALDEGGTLLVVCSDHGGGGANRFDHNSDHPDDTTIPVVLAGGGVLNTHLGSEVTLLDLPATVLWALGVEIPDSYTGRPLQEAFFREARAA